MPQATPSIDLMWNFSLRDVVWDYCLYGYEGTYWEALNIPNPGYLEPSTVILCMRI